MRGAAFDADEPALHRSFALGQAQDWAGVSDCVSSEARCRSMRRCVCGWWRAPSTDGQRVAALAAWCHVCWRAPAEVSAAVSKLRQPN